MTAELRGDRESHQRAGETASGSLTDGRGAVEGVGVMEGGKEEAGTLPGAEERENKREGRQNREKSVYSLMLLRRRRREGVQLREGEVIAEEETEIGETEGDLVGNRRKV